MRAALMAAMLISSLAVTTAMADEVCYDLRFRESGKTGEIKDQICIEECKIRYPKPQVGSLETGEVFICIPGEAYVYREKTTSGNFTDVLMRIQGAKLVSAWLDRSGRRGTVDGQKSVKF